MTPVTVRTGCSTRTSSVFSSGGCCTSGYVWKGLAAEGFQPAYSVAAREKTSAAFTPPVTISTELLGT